MFGRKRIDLRQPGKSHQKLLIRFGEIDGPPRPQSAAPPVVSASKIKPAFSWRRLWSRASTAGCSGASTAIATATNNSAKDWRRVSSSSAHSGFATNLGAPNCRPFQIGFPLYVSQCASITVGGLCDASISASAKSTSPHVCTRQLPCFFALLSMFRFAAADHVPAVPIRTRRNDRFVVQEKSPMTVKIANCSARQPRHVWPPTRFGEPASCNAKRPRRRRSTDHSRAWD